MLSENDGGPDPNEYPDGHDMRDRLEEMAVARLRHAEAMTAYKRGPTMIDRVAQAAGITDAQARAAIAALRDAPEVMIEHVSRGLETDRDWFLRTNFNAEIAAGKMQGELHTPQQIERSGKFSAALYWDERAQAIRSVWPGMIDGILGTPIEDHTWRAYWLALQADLQVRLAADKVAA